MLIEYTVELPCEPKRRLGVDGLFARLRCLARVLGTPSAGRDEASAGRKAEFELRPLAFHCARCPANHQGRAFGCFGIIQGPLSEEAEEWLVGLLPDTLRPRVPSSRTDELQIGRVGALVRRFRELGINGKAADSHRADGELLEAERPSARRYGSLLKPVSLSSSQLLHLLFLRERIDSRDAELVCRALGVWEDGPEQEDGAEVIFNQPADEDDDPSIAELKQFFLALIIACSLDLPVRTVIRDETEDDLRGLGVKASPAGEKRG